MPARWQHEVKLLAAIVIVVIITALADTNHNYWRNPSASVTDIARQTTVLGIFSLGAAIVIVSGGIDLSAGSVICFSGTMCATLLLWLAPERMQSPDTPLGTGVIVTAIAGTLFIGFLVGSLHAWLITVVGLPPFVATLATLVGLRSLARAVCEHATAVWLGGSRSQINIFDTSFRNLTTSVGLRSVLFLGLAGLMWLLLSKTVVGRHLHALGGNEEAARLSGIRTERLKWLAYCLSAMLSSLAGILYIGEQSLAEPQTLGRGYELNAIAAAVVGGCSLQGGIGTIPGTVFGALFLRVVIDGVAKIIKTGADVYEGLIVGVVVVCAVAFSQSTGSKKRLRFFAGNLGWVTILNLTLLTWGLFLIIGPELLPDSLVLEATHVALLAGGGMAGLLIVLRSSLSSTKQRWGIVAMAAGVLVAGATIQSQLPRYRAGAAVKQVQDFGGTVTADSSGFIVDLTGRPVGDGDLATLIPLMKFLPSRIDLRLAKTNITDRGTRLLIDLPNLKRLDVTGTPVTRRGVSVLSGVDVVR
ncbi:MAG: ABC transporter permease [Planctomycetota bacterium]|nr:ABC transporter permease [Planctomycetota bacterium]